MKKTLSYLPVILISIIIMNRGNVKAQYWKLGGNILTGNEKLGSLNKFPVVIITDNTERMRIDETGNVTIGLNAGPNKFLQFGLSSSMKFSQNQYIIHHSNSSEGLYFSNTLHRIEYRDQVAVPNMWIEWLSSGRSYFRGNMGIGAEPNDKRLFVKSSAAGELTRFDGGNGTFNTIFENGTYRGYWGSFAGNPEDIDIGTGGTNTTGKVHLTIQGVPKLTVNNNGNVGIGTSTPQRRLHVVNAPSGTGPNVNSPLVVENNTHNYISVLAPTASERGIFFGDPSNSQNGGIIYTGPTNDMQFRTNGNISRMVLSANGDLSIGALQSASYKVKISHGQLGLDLENSASGDDWELWASGSSSLNLYCNGSFRGSFNCTNGAYSSVSDARLKSDIQPMPAVLAKIKQLKPSTYQFKQGNIQEMGFIAQDVMNIFPGLVTHSVEKNRNLDVYTLNYSGFGVIAIKGIQELLQTIEEQKNIINSLDERLGKLEALLVASNPIATNVGGSAKTNVAINAASIEQNKPNPFSNSSSINYFIPAGAKNARLNVTDNLGKVIKQASLNPGKGVVNIDASLLGNGPYNYSLLIDGKLIESKKMIVAH